VDETTASYDAWHTRLEEPESDDQPTAPWHRLTIANLPDVRGKRVLEIGCGRGVFARHLAEQGANLVAADFSPAAVSYARRRLENHDAEVLVADVAAIPFPDESFDVVVSQETLEHIPDPRKGLAELVRVTKVGGTLIVTTPNYLNFVGLYRALMRLVGRRFSELGQPINQPLVLARQVRWLRSLGCRIVVVDGTGHYLPVPRYDVVELRWLERPKVLTKWFSLNSLTKVVRVR
jgi:2-polyprenyl-3-methyl-5-hydroxy-6-metoxy-1,4-benzoquinol methylase